MIDNRGGVWTYYYKVNKTNVTIGNNITNSRTACNSHYVIIVKNGNFVYK